MRPKHPHRSRVFLKKSSQIIQAWCAWKLRNPKLNQNLASSIERADELLKELESEYNRSLKQKQVSSRAVNLTHEICEKLRGILDKLARRYWKLHISPQLTAEDQERATIYFPICLNQDCVDTTLGRWRWKSVRAQHQPVYDYLLKLQPFQCPAHKWLAVLADLAIQGKHIDLVPQKRSEEHRITVNSPGGSVSWIPEAVTFPGGAGVQVSIFGVPIDPRTQRVVPNSVVSERIEVWVSFLISGHDVNALGFCQEACRETRRIAEEMSTIFKLS